MPFSTQIHFLGFVASGNRVYADPKKVRAIEEWSELKTIRDVKSFHGLITFIDNLSRGLALMVSITDCMKKSEFTWSSTRKHLLRSKKGWLALPSCVSLIFSKSLK